MRLLAGVTIGAAMLIGLSNAPATSAGGAASLGGAASAPAIGPVDAPVVTVAVRCYRYPRPSHSTHKKKSGKLRCVNTGPGIGPIVGTGPVATPGGVVPPGTGIVTFGNGPGNGITTFGRNRAADPRPGTGPFGNLGGR